MAITLPTAVDFKARYSMFAAVPDSVVTAIAGESVSWVDDTWIAADIPAAVMLFIAHTLMMEGYNASGTATGNAVSGRVTSVAVGDVKTTFEMARGSGSSGGHASFGETAYGRRFLDLMRRNSVGVTVV